MTFDLSRSIPIPQGIPGTGIQGVNPLRPGKNDGGPSFAETLKGYLNDVSRLEQEADKQVQGILEGKAVDPHEVMLAVQEANLALDLLIEIRNKLMEAYREIQRTPV